VRLPARLHHVGACTIMRAIATKTSPTCTASPLGLLAAAQFLVFLSINIPIVAVPTIGDDLGLAAVYAQFVVTAYALAWGALLLLGGRCADVFGRRRMLGSGLWIFIVGAVVAPLAPTGEILIASRAVQGAGAALIAPAALSLLTSIFPDGPERDRALGVLGAASGGGAALALFLGGVLTDALGWRSIFVPGLVLALVLAVFVPRLPAGAPSPRFVRELDLPGAIAVSAGLALLAFGVTQRQRAGLASVQAAGSLAAAAGLLAAFIVIERRQPAPLLPPRLLRRRTIAAPTAATLLIWAGFASLFFLLSLLLQNVLDYSPLATGLGYLPLAAAVAVASRVAARAVGPSGTRPVLVAGAAGVAVGSLLVGAADAGDSYAGAILPGIVIAGLGLGGALVALQVAVFVGVAEGESGVVAGLFTTAQEVASAIGTAALVALALAQGGGADGIQFALAVGAVVVIAGGLLGAAAIPRREPWRSR
jgi:MFS family permease